LANLIEQRVEMARNGQNPFVICKMESGWLVVGDVQPLPRDRSEPDDKRRHLDGASA